MRALIPQNLHPYCNTKMLICVVQGFSSGMPLYLLISLLSAWLKTEGVDLKAIGLFTLVGIPYTWKFIWSPLMDRYTPPFLGRRRGWMIITQILLFGLIVLLGKFSPQSQLDVIIIVCTLLAFVSASQDIVLDAYRREMLGFEQQGPGHALFCNAYKIAQLVPGALSLILSDHMPWSDVFIITGFFMLPGICTTLLIQEPMLYAPPPKTLRDAVVLPFREFVSSRGWRATLQILAFILLYRLGDAMSTSLSTPFYLDLGFSRTEIGIVAKNVGLWASIAGGLIGMFWMVKIGIHKSLWIFGIPLAASILGFAFLAHTGANLVVLAVVVGLEAFAVGLTTSAITAYLALATDPRYTATQFALLTSLAAVPRTLFSASSGYIVEITGWFQFFILCFALAVPGLWLAWKIAAQNSELPDTKINPTCKIR